MADSPSILTYSGKDNATDRHQMRVLLWLCVCFALTQALNSLWDWKRQFPGWPVAAASSLSWFEGICDIWCYGYDRFSSFSSILLAIAAFVATRSEANISKSILRIVAIATLVLFVVQRCVLIIDLTLWYLKTHLFWTYFSDLAFGLAVLLNQITIPASLLLILGIHREGNAQIREVRALRVMCTLAIALALFHITTVAPQIGGWWTEVKQVMDLPVNSLVTWDKYFDIGYWTLHSVISIPFGIAAACAMRYSLRGRKALVAAAILLVAVESIYCFENIGILMIDFSGTPIRFATGGRWPSALEWLADFLHYLTLYTALPFSVIIMLQRPSCRNLFTH